MERNPFYGYEAVDTELAKLPAEIQAIYLPEGNEARFKTAYANRDPRLAYNVVTPYANYLGVNSNSTAEAWYTFRGLLLVNIMQIRQMPNRMPIRSYRAIIMLPVL